MGLFSRKSKKKTKPKKLGLFRKKAKPSKPAAKKKAVKKDPARKTVAKKGPAKKPAPKKKATTRKVAPKKKVAVKNPAPKRAEAPKKATSSLKQPTTAKKAVVAPLPVRKPGIHQAFIEELPFDFYKEDGRILTAEGWRRRMQKVIETLISKN